jgi:hypothetical protein
MTASELTSRILTTLLRRQAAGTDELLTLLRGEHPTSRGRLAARLQALDEQLLVARVDGVWLLTDDGLAVARSTPAAFGLGIDASLTAPAAPDRSARSQAVTSLALSFLRAHRAAFGEAPFEWESRPHLRSRDGSGHIHEVRPTAAMKTFTYGPRGLEPVSALVELWAEEREAASAAERLRLYAELAAAGADHPARGPWRRWLGKAPLLLVTLPTGTMPEVVVDAFREAATPDARLRSLLRSVPVGVASADAIGALGVDAAVWWSPIEGKKQVWQQLGCGMERAREVSCAISACHLTG